MGIDASIYSQIQPPQPPALNITSPLATAEAGMRLSQLGMQNQAMRYQQQQQQIGLAQNMAVRQAYTDNTDQQTGALNRQGFLSDLGKNAYTAPMAGDYAEKFSAQDKAQADAQSAKMKAASDALNSVGPAFDYLHSMSPDDRADAYPKVVQQLKSQGVDTTSIDHPYNPSLFNQYYGTWQQTKPALENQLTQANIAKTQTEQQQVGISKGAEELGKFNEDVNNASSRKTTGALIDSRNRADRILTLVGRQPNESDQQYFSRLNQYIPQIGTEVGTSLASIMQGGIPNEAIQEKLSPDTVQAKLAELQQRWTASPTAANQGQLLAAYSDIAGKLRDFSAGRLKETTDRAAQAYPYAQKYFPDRMQAIAAPLTKPGASSEGTSSSPGQQQTTQQYRAKGAGVSGDELAQYAMKHGLSLAKAQKSLEGAGYVVNQ